MHQHFYRLAGRWLLGAIVSLRSTRRILPFLPQEARPAGKCKAWNLHFPLALFSKKGFTFFLIVTCVFIQSKAFASFPSSLVIKWNPQDSAGVAGYTDTPEAACQKAIPYFVGQYSLPGGSVYDHVEPRPGYESVQQSCWAKYPPNWTLYWASVVLLMGSCNGGTTYTQGLLSCPASCPANSTLTGTQCTCNSGYSEAGNACVVALPPPT